MIDQPRPAIGYSRASILMHWLTVSLVILQFAIAWTMPDIGRGTLPIGLVSWHLSVGVAILAVTFVRLGWRLSHRSRPAPSDLPVALRLISRSTHWIMYVLLVVLPVLGWVNANARGWPVRLFGVFYLPQLVAKGSSWGMRMGDLHGNLAILLLVAIGLHVLGAAYHAVILKDRTLDRMLRPKGI